MSSELVVKISQDRIADICEIIITDDDNFQIKTRTQKLLTIIYLLVLEGNKEHYSRELLVTLADPELLNIADQIMSLLGGE